MMDDSIPEDESNGPDVYPTGNELPDEEFSPDDIAPFVGKTSGISDINELATAEWKESTTADERIRAVLKRTVSAKTAHEIADTAAVSETKARNALNSLAEEGLACIERTESGTTYRRDPDRYLIEQIHRLSMADDLVDRIQAAKGEIADYRERYDTDAPNELLVSDRTLTAEELTDISHWRTAVRDLEYLRAAYRIQQAKRRTSTSSLETLGENSDPASAG
ncbi:ArsR family transcriptional regulator [Halonotius pteroides]|uniref:ArsR family transcriptional regulator n=2 Tax=Halonotius pteroides TaxID=268735 RepID=A0A3A6QEY8_9EURY|nr:ArsR family transcriptional regulator [Halonotius pteroides]